VTLEQIEWEESGTAGLGQRSSSGAPTGTGGGVGLAEPRVPVEPPTRAADCHVERGRHPHRQLLLHHGGQEGSALWALAVGLTTLRSRGTGGRRARLLDLVAAPGQSVQNKISVEVAELGLDLG
jgi:hypothetical protein